MHISTTQTFEETNPLTNNFIFTCFKIKTPFFCGIPSILNLITQDILEFLRILNH